MQTEAEYEARSDAGRTYACYNCAMPVQELEERLESTSKSCEVAVLELQKRRSTVAIQHVRVLDSIRSKPRLLRARLIEEGQYLYSMYKRVAFLIMLKEQSEKIEKKLGMALITRLACLHRYDKMGSSKIYGGSF